MNALSLAYNNELATVTSLNFNLFNDFISFVDRCEKTTQTYIKNLRQFAAWLKYENITAPVRKDILSYRDYLATEHYAIKLDLESVTGWAYRTTASGNRVTVKCKPNTIKQYLQSVCQFFRWTASEGIYPNIAENIHAPKIKTDTHRKEALTASDVRTIEKSIAERATYKIDNAALNKKDTAGRIDRATEQGKRLYAMYLLAVNCGLRTVEISRANIKDIETKNGTSYIYVWGKGHSEADTKKALAREVKEAIDDYLSCRADGKNGNAPLFTATGNRSKGKRIATTTISTMLKRAMQEAGYNSERITAHSLRHTAGTNVQELTGNLYLTQQYMRHANPATTEIYLHNDTEKKETEIAQNLYNYYHGKKENAGAGLQDLENIIAIMTPEKVEQLKAIAIAMTK